MKSIGYFITPFVIGIIAILLSKMFSFNYELEGFSEVLSSIIGFSSTIIGFYSAMYGIIVSIPDSKLLRRWKEKDLVGKFKYQIIASLMVSVFVFILSIFLQIGINYSDKLIEYIFLTWIFSVAFLIVITVQTIILFIFLIFDEDENFDNEKVSF